MKPRYIIMTASAHMPRSCWGKYGRVAVVEVDYDALPEGWTRPAQISERSKGIVRIVEVWDRLNVGKTERCAHSRALHEASELCDRLNAEGAHE